MGGEDRPSREQMRIVALCGLAALCDGFDTQAIAFVAPVVSRAWGVSPSAFGPVFSAGLAGLALGAFLFGPLADRLGRKIVILICVALFGLGSLATTLAVTPAQMAAWRAITGLGLGGVLPNLISFTNESTTGRFKNVAVMIMICGFPLGATLAGFISAPLTALTGWKGLLLLGGMIPLGLLVPLHLALPSDRRTASPAVNRETTSLNVAAIFAGKLLVPTLLLWVAFFANLLVLYFLVNWLPSLLSLQGSSFSVASICTAVLNLGGIGGALAFSRLVNRGAFPLYLCAAYMAGVVSILAIVYGSDSTVILMLASACAGGIVIGGQMAMNAVTASFYPDEVRATGVGWALGVGRVGSIIGPLAGSIAIDAHWQGTTPLLLATGPLLAAAVAIAFFGIIRNREQLETP